MNRKHALYAETYGLISPSTQPPSELSMRTLLAAVGATILVDGTDEDWEAYAFDYEELDETVLRLLEDGSAAMGMSWADCDWTLGAETTPSTAGWRNRCASIVPWHTLGKVRLASFRLSGRNHVAEVDVGCPSEVVVGLLTQLGRDLAHEAAFIHSFNGPNDALDALVVIPRDSLHPFLSTGLLQEVDAAERRSALRARNARYVRRNIVYFGSPDYHVAWLPDESPSAKIFGRSEQED